MKTLLTILLLLFGVPQERVVYKIEYYDPLNGTQIRLVLNTMIGQFSPNCRPNSLTVSSSGTILYFGSPCISGEELKNVSLRTIPDARVRKIYRDGGIVWPTPPLNDKKK